MHKELQLQTPNSKLIYLCPMERKQEVLQDVVIKFAGDSGDGMQLTGTQFTNNTAM